MDDEYLKANSSLHWGPNSIHLAPSSTDAYILVTNKPLCAIFHQKKIEMFPSNGLAEEFLQSKTYGDLLVGVSLPIRSFVMINYSICELFDMIPSSHMWW